MRVHSYETLLYSNKHNDLKQIWSVTQKTHSQPNASHLSPVGTHTAEVIQVTQGIRKATEAHAGLGPPHLQAHIIRGCRKKMEEAFCFRLQTSVKLPYTKMKMSSSAKYMYAHFLIFWFDTYFLLHTHKTCNSRFGVTLDWQENRKQFMVVRDTTEQFAHTLQMVIHVVIHISNYLWMLIGSLKTSKY